MLVIMVLISISCHYKPVWHYTDIPEEMVNILVKDIEKFNENMGDSKLHGDAVNKDIR